ncbi:ABC transporter ATP-binding protein [Pseudoflavonifractor sp. 524-17]|uniref:ABC transporter ATP-binding protein n=1 Tax=Pseudoflavonifractor sp. 524-17 TaxID=2304577 RepID=UPI00137B68A4|nr:ABC transporter ATP-binding protein [Pseudoflavonifractor sp. 524-17]NCE66208.1 ABC transporter ATP-binding protein [Pseudoflavonifractor sp. 524-17]
MSSQYAIEINHLTKDYGSFRLDDISFALPGGTILGLIGENGAGKSTTIKCILNLIRRDAGEITIFGRDNLADERAVKEEIGLVLDECPFNDNLNAAQVEAILAPAYPSWDAKCYAAYLDKFELSRKKTIKEYSRGMKMKLSIAAALSHRPRLLLLDEPTSGLDPVVRDAILDEFLNFISDEDHAILLSSHITSDLEKIADYVAYLHKGRLAVCGPKDELLASHGRLACSEEELAQVDPRFLVGARSSRFQCQALVRDREEFCRRYRGLSLDPVTLEDIMVFTVRGDKV